MKCFNSFDEMFENQKCIKTERSVFNALEEDWAASFQSKFPNLNLSTERSSSSVTYKIRLNDDIATKVWKMDDKVIKSEFPVLRKGLPNASLRIDFNKDRYALSPDRSTIVVPVSIELRIGVTNKNKKVRTYASIPYDGETELDWNGWSAPKFIEAVSEDAFYDVAKQTGFVDDLLNFCADEEAEIAKLDDYFASPHFSVKVRDRELPNIPTVDKWGTSGDLFVDAPVYDNSYID